MKRISPSWAAQKSWIALKAILLPLRTASSSSPHGSSIAHLGLMMTYPFLASCLLRAATGLSLKVSLGIALLFFALALALAWPWLRSRLACLRALSASAWTAEALTLGLVGAAMYALSIRDFGGFPNLDGWDGGTHVLIKDQFAQGSAEVYSGQVTYHALAWWLEQLFGLNSLQSFSATFYIGVVGAVTFPVTVMLAAMRSNGWKSQASVVAGLVTTVAATLGILWLVWLPLLHYNQAAGYYAHVLGLWPLGMLWAADALIRYQPMRVVALLGGLVFLRFTYALNLTEAFMAVAFALFLDASRGRLRLAQIILAVGLGAMAWPIFSQLRPVFHIWGGMQRFAVDSIFYTDLLLIGGGMAYVLLSSSGRRPRQWANSALARTLRFPLLFAAFGSALLPILRSGPGVQQYYVTKYLVWACMLLAFVLVIMTADLVATVMQPASFRRLTVWLRLALVAVLLATVPGVWQKTFHGYRETFQERLLAQGPPYRFLRPLADTPTIERIKDILADRHKLFGGYLTAFMPMFNFMNAALGRPGRQEFFPPVTSPGHCVFWVNQPYDIYRLGPAQQLDALRNQVAVSGSICTVYPVAWKTTLQSLCYRCY